MPFKKGHKGFARKSTRISLTHTPTPQPIVDDEDDMMDADDTRDATPQEDGDEEGEEDAGTPAAGEDDEDAATPPTVTAIPRRRGRGGRSRGRIGHRHTPDVGGDDGSESGTPLRRRRGRPPGSTTGRGRGGFRGRRKTGQTVEAPKVVIDKDGTTLDVVDDEALVDDDDEGNEKVDSNGLLQGGREYRVRTFTIMGREDRLYMLSTEPARCCGFRDSYLFFTKHPKLYKVLIGEDEKMDLIARDILPNSYKGRNIGVVTARSVFREFGARIIVGGRRVIDDYKETEARENGEVEGELADPDDYVPENRADYNRNRYVAWFGASEVYRTQGSSGTLPTGKPGPIGKRRNNITLQNWQAMHAKEASRFNSTLTSFRKANLNGVYDTHTNMMFYPTIMQPTHAKWEYIPPAPPSSTSKDVPLLTNGVTNGVGEHSTSMDLDHPPTATTLFPPVPRPIAQNFTIIDTQFTSPSIAGAGYPGPDGAIVDRPSGPNGLTSVPDDLIDELPDDCRLAFERARATERHWKEQWGTEAQSALRGGLKIGFLGYPV